MRASPLHQGKMNNSSFKKSFLIEVVYRHPPPQEIKFQRSRLNQDFIFLIRFNIGQIATLPRGATRKDE
ncbi:hypothetical protein D3A96_13825 [Robertkochia marina]|nr:hypothetical protein D3A96_13825 [Robertkochia marina]